MLGRWAASLRPGGQLAVQVPANIDHPSHHVSSELATEPWDAAAFGGEPPPDPVQSVHSGPRSTPCVLDRLGFEHQHVRLQVYGHHHLGSTADVVEWVKGTSLTRFRRVLDDETYASFEERYRQRLVAALGDHRPYFYAFKRILMWGQLP